MTGDDLIVAAPWLAFAAGLAVIGWRLAAGRGRRRRRGPPACGGAPGPGRTRPVTGPLRAGQLRRTAGDVIVKA